MDVVKESSPVYEVQMQNGKGTYIDRFHKVCYSGQWKNNDANGIGTIQNYFTGTKFIGQFCKSEMVRGTMTWETGAEYIGEFSSNEMDGIGQYTWPNGTIYLGNFKEGKLNGVGTVKKNGQTWKVKYENGIQIE